jgi:phosphohistidine swiveling domain-containing protein
MFEFRSIDQEIQAVEGFLGGEGTSPKQRGKFTETPIDQRGNIDEIKARIEKFFQGPQLNFLSNESSSKTVDDPSKLLRANKTKEKLSHLQKRSKSGITSANDILTAPSAVVSRKTSKPMISQQVMQTIGEACGFVDRDPTSRQRLKTVETLDLRQ